MKYHNITQSIVTVKTTQVEIRLFTNELNHALYEEDYNLACILRDKIKEKEYSIEKVKSMLEKHLSELKFFDNDYIFERSFLTNFLKEDMREGHPVINNSSLDFYDNYHSENSHVIPALIRRFHEAKVLSKPDVIVWGTGKPRREFLYVDDMATASIHVMNLAKGVYDQYTSPMQSHINVGYGDDVTIADLAHAVSDAIGYSGKIIDLESAIGKAEVIDVKSIEGKNIKFGATVEIEDDDRGNKQTYQIVGEYESDIENKKLSITSPLARGLIGKKEEDNVEISSPKGLKSYTILSVKYI